MQFNPYTIQLPIVDCFDELSTALESSKTLILHAPPGAGKSTTVPLLFHYKNQNEGKKIIMLEPRRLAARTIATRMADLLGEKIGHTVGYRVRFDTCVSEHTIIEVVTEGILTRMLQTDNALEGVGIVIFDEFHERSIHADLALTLCRESQNYLRPDLKIVVMSATLNLPRLTKLLDAPLISSEGKCFDVEIFYGNGIDERLAPELTAKTVIEAVKKHEGDCLVFLPGQAEILKCAGILKQQLPTFAIHPLYGQLSQSKQYHAIVPDKHGRRKVVIATSIAETSLTIEGVKIVVDSGLSRTARFDAKSGLMQLRTMRVSADIAEQRTGRAGRLSEGACYRLWSRADHDRLVQHTSPEILEADLCSLVLETMQWGITNINDLSWLDTPPEWKVSTAKETLQSLSAIEDDSITEHGSEVQSLPCHPRIAHMLILAQKEGSAPLACDIAALLEERDPLPQEQNVDINVRIDAIRKSRSDGNVRNIFMRLEKIAAQYRRMLKVEEDNSTCDVYETGLLLSYAYPERIACSRPGNNAQFQMANGKIAAIGHKDTLAYESWISIAHVDARDGLGKVFMASPLNPKDLAPMVKSRERVEWDSKTGAVQAYSELAIGSIVLQKKPQPDTDPELIADAICDAMAREGESILNFTPRVRQWQNRVLSLRKWNLDQNWPDITTVHLLKNAKQWLSPYLTGIRKAEDLKRLDLFEILHSSLTWEQQQLIEELTPERIEVLSGSNIKLEYSEHGTAPVLAVRIQEVFGMKTSPTVNRGKVAVQLHLLSPARRPVQITSDLDSFWNGAYHEVRKELKIKYPKHVWPEDPWNEPAIKGIKRKQRGN